MSARPGGGDPGIRVPAGLVRAASLLWLVVVWAALWGDASLGTAIGGALVGAGVLVVVSRGTVVSPASVRPVAIARLAGVFLLMLVQSTVAVVRSTLHVSVVLRSVVLTVELPPCPPAVATLVANAVTLTPGTLSLELNMHPDESATLLVHALDAEDAADVRRDVLRLHALASAAFGRASDAEVPPPAAAATRTASSGASPYRPPPPHQSQQQPTPGSAS